jgi:hypothetical protein
MRGKQASRETSKKDPAAVGYGLLVFCGFILAGALTVFIAVSLRSGDTFRTLFHAGLLWFTVRLLLRNLDNLEKARAGGAGHEREEGVDTSGKKASANPRRPVSRS